ncbi:hypothetical protein A9Q86_09880 [Flavobacteriales bacterium 33_180_T64]|nr:hypothetical protein A9Q86_09880 [Flavobacteriales bacterium 33_180_T64]
MKHLLKKSIIGVVAVLLTATFIFYILVTIPLPEPPKPNKSLTDIVIKNTNIVDIESDSIYEQSLLIKNGVIIEIGDYEAFQVPKNTYIIDGKGKYAIPGLWDMHAHVNSILAPHFSFPLYISNGVTHIRDMGGHAEFTLKKEWRAQIEANTLLGPRLEGIGSTFVSNLTSVEHTNAIINSFSGEMNDFVKTYNGILPKYYFQLLDEAEKKSISILGHRPRAVSAIEASKAGHKSFEHARLFLFECYSGSEELRAKYLTRYKGEFNEGGALDNTTALRDMIDNHSESMFEDLVNEMVKNNTWFCPTHLTRKMDAYADNEAYLNDPRLKYINAIERRNWIGDTKGMINMDPTPEGRKTYMDFYKKGLELTGKAHKAGVKILAGTDANDTFCFPGFSIHDELLELVKAGLKPSEALKSATIHPASYFNLSHKYGTLEIGKVADIIILEKNPLSNIANTKKINMIIDGRHVYSRSNLDEILTFVELMNGNTRATLRLFWIDFMD